MRTIASAVRLAPVAMLFVLLLNPGGLPENALTHLSGGSATAAR